MPKLFHPLLPMHKLQIKLLAAAQERIMVKKSIQKNTAKKQVYYPQFHVACVHSIGLLSCLPAQYGQT